MENSLIEQFDKARYNMIKWLTIGWAVWVGSYILKGMITNHLIVLFFVYAGLLGWILFIINLIQYLKLRKEINADSKLKEALANNEMIQQYAYKSFFIGFCVFVVTIVCFFAVSLFQELSALFVSRTTLYLGVLSALVANLIYNRS